MMFEALNTKNQPLVSVIMNCLNGERYLRGAIDSIYAQTYKDWEIIFWDNASTDNSAEIAKSYDGKLRYFRGDVTVPLYAARNLALREANGKYIAFLDCDDYWLPHKLERQVQIFEGNKSIGLVYSNVEILEGITAIRKMHTALQPSGKIFRQMLKHYNINIQTVVISRTALESLNEWFDDSLNLAGDTDLFLRIAHDWDVKYLPVVTARYREHGDNLSLKLAEDVPVEVEYIIGKFSNLYRDFIREYDPELIYLRMRLRKGLAVSKWKSGQNSEARSLITRHLRAMYPFVLVWFLSFFPYKTMSSLRGNILFKWLHRLKSV